MTMEEARKALSELQLHEFAYTQAMSTLYYDSVTVAPAETWAPRGKTLAILTEEAYKLSTGGEAVALLDFLSDHESELSQAERRIVELKQKSLRELRRIPVEEYVAYSELLNQAQNVWRKAKEASNYAMFEPYLSRIVAANRRFAALVEPDKPPYDYLLDKYEEGLTEEKCDAFFDALRARLVPLLAKARSAPQPDTAVLEVRFPLERQKELSDYVMGVMGIDRGHCGLGTTEHPFTMGFSKHDVRITTHYHEGDFASSLYSVIHEGGHALYELHTADEFAYTELGAGVSMGIHESQSRFFENILGRSKEFINFLYPELVRLCPAIGDHTADELYRAVNRAQPSLIRTEADELTYYLHIMVRYQLEKGLISGEISTRDLPEKWNALYKEYLGIDVPDDARGVLQDSHWSGGQIGYFPSYALGSAYGAQLLAKMKHTVGVNICMSKGNFAPVNAWLEDRIWKYGRLPTPTELLEKAVGEPFDPLYYIEYLKSKIKDVYGV
jgi:carboxypeptidase Taq